LLHLGPIETKNMCQQETHTRNIGSNFQGGRRASWRGWWRLVQNVSPGIKKRTIRTDTFDIACLCLSS